MATVLCVWEMGSDLGHLSMLRGPIEIALQMGHRVVLAARQLHRVPDVLGGLPITYLQAPFKQNVVAADASVFLSYTHLLARQCFSGVDELEIYLRAWCAIFDLVKPDLVLYEHSPTALIASGGYSFKKVLLGSGFTIPRLPVSTSEPFAPFITTPTDEVTRNSLLANDALVLRVVNQALARLGATPWDSIAAPYAQADAQFLMTWPELDHFGPRPGARYLGIAGPRQRQVPRWPPGTGLKVFGYLHAMPALEPLLRDLTAARVCALLVVAGLPQKFKETYTSEHLHFADQLVDLSLVAAQAAWVINHANHNTMANFMLAGVPQLVIPRHQEQLFVALRLKAQGGALMAFQDQPAYANEIRAMNSNSALKQQALRLQVQCKPITDLNAQEVIRQTLSDLLTQNREVAQ